MSAIPVKEAIVNELKKADADFVCLNFANSDMVGHTGIYDAIKKAVETVDECVKQVTETAIASGYRVMITADHGNADYAVNPDGSANTAHSMNDVPCFVYAPGFSNIKNGRLADIAPTLLKMMEMEIPEDMTGNVLIL